MQNIEVKEGIIDDDKYNDLFSVEEVNRLVNEGVPFRDAYIQVGKELASGGSSINKEVNHTHIGSIGNPANDEIKAKMDKVLSEFNFEVMEKALQQLAN
jgi:argininosuccinate lyase